MSTLNKLNKLDELRILLDKYCYKLLDTEFKHKDISVECPIHGVFLTTSYNIRNETMCFECYTNGTKIILPIPKIPELQNMKEIPDFENYMISKDAKIYSKLERNFLQINIESFKENKRRVRIKIYNNKGERKCMDLARLVALTYILNPENKPEVNHKDGKPYNNHYDNLEWNTKPENMEHARVNGLIKPVDQGIRVEQYDLQGNFIKKYDSMKEAAKENGVSTDSIKDCLYGKTKNPKYFIWKYTEIKEEVYDNEKWKPIIIDEVDTQYKISDKGRCRNKQGELLKGHEHQGKYICVDIVFIKGDDIIKKSKRLHVLVATAFIPNPENKPEVDHIDTNVQNNKVDNLRWYTHKENMNNENTKKKLYKAVLQMDKDGNILNEFKSINDAKDYVKKNYNKTTSGISDVCNGNPRYKTAGGFYWKFK
ncbi:HNH endonuclease [Klosneuvirus KNV1]|uniref:HNH endonuclease n=1 Tax=Klosneuvirus KNV1 TaxID=1977640 RepID=A0A1V0SJ74_9VIRU|nr:HNH endonuclease [Klosneuvirus KNV1]